MATVNKSGNYQLKSTDVDVSITAGPTATVTIVPPIPYTVNGQRFLTLYPAQSVSLKLSQKNWSTSNSYTASQIANIPFESVTATNTQQAINQLAAGAYMIDTFYTVAGQNTYTRTALMNKTVVTVNYGNMVLIPSQWTKPYASTQFTLTDTSFPVEDGTYVTIFYR